MRQTRITKRRHRPDRWRQAPLPHDPRDPDIVRAHEAGRVRPAGPARTKPVPGDR